MHPCSIEALRLVHRELNVNMEVLGAKLSEANGEIATLKQELKVMKAELVRERCDKALAQLDRDSARDHYTRRADELTTQVKHLTDVAACYGRQTFEIERQLGMLKSVSDERLRIIDVLMFISTKAIERVGVLEGVRPLVPPMPPSTPTADPVAPPTPSAPRKAKPIDFDALQREKAEYAGVLLPKCLVDALNGIEFEECL